MGANRLGSNGSRSLIEIVAEGWGRNANGNERLDTAEYDDGFVSAAALV
jgi:hypothetical protein